MGELAEVSLPVGPPGPVVLVAAHGTGGGAHRPLAGLARRLRRERCPADRRGRLARPLATGLPAPTRRRRLEPRLRSRPPRTGAEPVRRPPGRRARRVRTL